MEIRKNKNSKQVADVSKKRRQLFLPFSQNNYVLTHYFYDPLQQKSTCISAAESAVNWEHV